MRARGGPGAAPAQSGDARVVDVPAHGAGLLSLRETLNFVGRLPSRRARPLAGGGGGRRGPSRGEGAEEVAGRLLPARA